MKIVSSAPASASLLHPAAFSSSGEAAGSSCFRGYLQWLQGGEIPSRAVGCVPAPSFSHVPRLAHSQVLPCPPCHLCVTPGSLVFLSCSGAEAGPGTWLLAVPEWRHCRAPGVISCLLLSSGSSLPRPFPSSKTTPTPRCSGGRRVAVAAFQGGSPCRGTVPATVPARPALSGLCHLLARGQQCWATRWHN